MSTRVIVLDGGAPWGFRMHGGSDSHQPLRISRVNPGSKAALKGIREGDLITSINGQSTRDVTNSASHALLKSAGDVLKLGLNEDCSGSPKRRQYKSNTIKKETISSETIQRSSISSTTYEISKLSTNDLSNNRQEDEVDSSSSSYSNNREEKLKNLSRDGIAVSQRSTLSSNCSSSASTPSHLSDTKGRGSPVTGTTVSSNNHQQQQLPAENNLVDISAIDSFISGIRDNTIMPDNNSGNAAPNSAGNNSRSRRRRRANHHRKKSSHQQNNITVTVPCDMPTVSNTTAAVMRDESPNSKYRVDSPKTVSKNNNNNGGGGGGGIAKSKSLDGVDQLKIVELSETSDLEDKPTLCEHSAIITDNEIQWESTGELHQQIPQKNCRPSLSTLTLSLMEDGSSVTQTLISPEDEHALRSFLQNIHLVTKPNVLSAKSPPEKTSPDNIRAKRQQKREELAEYFAPAYHTPHFLDAISEEGSDLSDREAAGRRYNTMRCESLRDVPKEVSRSSLQVSRELAEVSRSNLQVSRELAEVSRSNMQVPSLEEVEIVHLESTSSSSESEDEDSKVKTEPIYENVAQLKNESPDDKDNLEYLQTVDISFRKEFKELLNEVDLQENYTSSRRSSTTSSSDESIGTTAKLNPLRSSVADVTSVLEDEEHAESLAQLQQPRVLKELCLERLVALPFGEDVLAELADVSNSLKYLTDHAKPPPQFHLARNASANAVYNTWPKLLVNDEINTVLCLSPTQRNYLETCPQIANEADQLLNLHEKFYERSRSSPGKKLPSAEDNNVTVIIKNQRKAVSMENLPQESNSGLLDIMLRESCSNKLPTNVVTTSRLHAKDLNEWLTLARNRPNDAKSSSSLLGPPPTTTTTTSGYRNVGPMPRKTTDARAQRRNSLPQELFVRQMQQLIDQEKEVQRELERLEAEKRRLTTAAATIGSLEQELRTHNVNNYKISKKGDIAIHEEEFNNNGDKISEQFRQEMYNEYMDKFAQREKRKQNKIIKLTATTTSKEEKGAIRDVDVESEFMAKVQEKLEKRRSNSNNDETKEALVESRTTITSNTILIREGDELQEDQQLPPHLQEFVEIARSATSEEADLDELKEYDGIWSPGQGTTSTQQQQDLLRQLSDLSQDSSSCAVGDNTISSVVTTPRDGVSVQPPIWIPRSAGCSPTAERKEFRPVNFESPKPARKVRAAGAKSDGSSDTEPSWKTSHSSTGPSVSVASIPTALDSRLPTSRSAPGFTVTPTTPSRLPRAQNPTITLLQKAREGQLPKGASYIEENRTEYPQISPRSLPENRTFYNPSETVYQIKSDYTSDSETERNRRMVDSRPRNYEGIGPTTKDGMPVILRSEIQDSNQGKWYKKMYDTIHKQKPRYDDEYVTIRYKQRRAGRYPYVSGYLSEPEPGAGYDSDATMSDYNRYATLDRRRTPAAHSDNEYAMSYTLPRNTNSVSYTQNDSIQHSQQFYKNQPGRIENYTPGQSSVSDKEAKQWWDEVLDIFDGHLEQQKRMPPQTIQHKGHMSQALKESGYESDSTLVFRRRDDTAQLLSPNEQKEVYKNIQKGGDVPLHGLRKTVPDRPKDDEDDLEYFPISPNLNRIRVHKSPKINNVIQCYPVRLPPNVFGSFKRTANSASRSNLLTPPPAPPKRYSSRNNTTLRYFSQVKPKPQKQEYGKRHESCFSPQQEQTKVKYLREKICCKLSPSAKRKSDGSLPSTSTLKDGAAKIGKPVTIKPTATRKVGLSKSSSSLDRTFGSEKKKVDLTLSKLERKKIVKSPELKSPREVKKAVMNQIDSLASQNKLKRTLTSSKDKVKLATSEKKSTNKPTKSPEKVAVVNSKLQSNVLVTKSRCSSTDSLKTKTGKLKEIIVPKSRKAKKDKINIEMVLENKKSATKHQVDVNDNVQQRPVNLQELKLQKEAVQSDRFFQNLFMRDVSSPTPSNSFITNKIDTLQRRASYIEPSVGALKVYLNATKPVTDSKFKMLDSCRSRSASPRCFSLNYDNYSIRRSMSSPPKLVVSQTPVAKRAALKEFRPVVEKYEQRMYFSDTTRPISPQVIRRGRVVEKFASTSPSPTLYFSETSRPVSPAVVHRKFPSTEHMIFYPSLMHKSPERLIFSDTTRPISPLVERRITRTPSPQTPRSIRSPSCRKIQSNKRSTVEYRSKSLESDTRSQFEAMYFEPSSLNFSTSSIDSCGTSEYQQYVSSTRRSDRFKELNKFYADLERLGELEKRTSSLDLRPRRRRHEDEIIDYDRWQEVRAREKAEKELSHLYKQLNEYQQEKDLLFRPKCIETFRWRKDCDRGLRVKEQSVEDIKETFERLKEKEKLKQNRWKKELEYRRQIYKPLWRGNSVVNLAQILNEKRSLSEGRQPGQLKKKGLLDSDEERLLTHGVGSRIWSSLSMDQVNVLKNQLTEIYCNNNGDSPKKPSEAEPPSRKDFAIDVNLQNRPSKPSNLFVRRNSDCLQSRKEKEDGLSENDKRRLSQSLSKEVLERQKQKYHSSISLVLGKETRGAILSSDLKNQESPRICYSLEMSEDGKEEKSKDNDFVLVLTKDNNPVHRNSVSETLEVWAQPKKALVTTNALNTPQNTKNSETDSTDGSTKTVICNNIKEKVQEKVEFFEREKEVYTPTIHKPLEPVSNDFETNLDKQKSQSQQDLKQLFGEQMHLAMQPLAASRKSEYLPPDLPKLRSKFSASNESLLGYRSRSLSPFPADTFASLRHGDVCRLREKFEHLEDFYSHRVKVPRRSSSDPTLNKTRYVSMPRQNDGMVDTLRKRYEYPSLTGRGRSRMRRKGTVSPVRFNEDRFMPHINVISKIARLYTQKDQQTPIKYRSNEELAHCLGIPLGEVDKLKTKFDSRINDDISLLGHMFTSAPNLSEAKSISNYLTAGWVAHKYPNPEDNAKRLSAGKSEVKAAVGVGSSRDVSQLRKDRPRAKSSSPVTKCKLSSILKKNQNKVVAKPVVVVAKEPVKKRIYKAPSAGSLLKPSVSFKGGVLDQVEYSTHFFI